MRHMVLRCRWFYPETRPLDTVYSRAFGESVLDKAHFCAQLGTVLNTPRVSVGGLADMAAVVVVNGPGATFDATAAMEYSIWMGLSRVIPRVFFATILFWIYEAVS